MSIRKLLDLVNDDAGVTTFEYALCGALIAVVCVALVGAVGANVEALYLSVCTQVTTAISGAPSC